MAKDFSEHFPPTLHSASRARLERLLKYRFIQKPGRRRRTVHFGEAVRRLLYAPDLAYGIQYRNDIEPDPGFGRPLESIINLEEHFAQLAIHNSWHGFLRTSNALEGIVSRLDFKIPPSKG